MITKFNDYKLQITENPIYESDLFINPENKKIFVCLGDSNPFGETEKLEDYIRYGCINRSQDKESFEIIIENECIPNSDEHWYKFDINGNITKH